MLNFKTVIALVSSIVLFGCQSTGNQATQEEVTNAIVAQNQEIVISPEKALSNYVEFVVSKNTPKSQAAIAAYKGDLSFDNIREMRLAAIKLGYEDTAFAKLAEYATFFKHPPMAADQFLTNQNAIEEALEAPTMMEKAKTQASQTGSDIADGAAELGTAVADTGKKAWTGITGFFSSDEEDETPAPVTDLTK